MTWEKLPTINSGAEMCVIFCPLGFTVKAEWLILKDQDCFLSQDKASSAGESFQV